MWKRISQETGTVTLILKTPDEAREALTALTRYIRGNGDQDMHDRIGRVSRRLTGAVQDIGHGYVGEDYGLKDKDADLVIQSLVEARDNERDTSPHRAAAQTLLEQMVVLTLGPDGRIPLQTSDVYAA